MIVRKVYTCDNCRFIFEGLGKVEQCPDCGKFRTRPATEQEQEEYWQHRIEFGYVVKAQTA